MLSHAQALLTSTPEGACAYVDADIRDTGKILKDAANVLDFSRPVGVCLIMILQFIPDEDDPASIVRALIDAVPSGSYLTIAHPASDVDQYVGPALRQLNTRMGGTRALPRSHQQVSSFFDGLDLVEPGATAPLAPRTRRGRHRPRPSRLRCRRPQALNRAIRLDRHVACSSSALTRLSSPVTAGPGTPNSVTDRVAAATA